MNPREEGEKLKEFYRTSTAYLTENIGGHDRAYFQVYLDRVRKYVPEKAHLLDLGCGTGFSSMLLGELGYRVTGVDISSLFLDPSNESERVSLVVADASHLPFPDGTFDAVTSYAFIEHVADVALVLDQMIRVTKPGGTILILSPNLVSPAFALKGLLRVFVLGKKGAMAVVGTSVWECLGTLMKNSYLTARKLVRKRVEFNFRIPRCDQPGNPDQDSVYLACQIDLNKYFEDRGLRVVGHPEGQSWIGKRIAKWFPSLSGECFVVARKVRM
jgi:ubiquinone/menaquinone biosynthesis C-methylase UbiE